MKSTTRFIAVVAQIACLMAVSVARPAAAEDQNGSHGATATIGNKAGEPQSSGTRALKYRKDLPANLDEEFVDLREDYLATLRGWEEGHPFDYAARSRAIEFMNSQRIELPGAAGTSPSLIQLLTVPAWTELGPAPIPNGQTQAPTVNPVSGRVTAIEVDPSDPNKVYVGTAQGGVYRSLNGGTTWTPIFDSAQSLAIGALALDAANGRLYVGTGEANGSADSFGGVGIYRIDNVNTSVTLVGPINPVRNYLDAASAAQSVAVFTGRSISKILIVANDPTTLLVGTAGGVIGIGGDPPFNGAIPPLGLRGLYKLTNVTSPPAAVGVTRIGIRSGSGIEGCFDTPCTGNRNLNDMVFDPGDVTGNTLIVWLNGTNVANDGGIWRTTNAVTGAPPTFTRTLATTATSVSNGRGALAIYKEGANPAVVYAASGEPSSGTLCNNVNQAGALRRSVDGGLTFGAKLQGGGGFCGGQCFYNVALAVLPGATTATNDDKILLGGNVRGAGTPSACQKLQGTSLDGGATTFADSDVGLHADSHAIAIAPSNPLIVYRGDDGGIFKSVDGGATWASLNNATFRATQFSGISVHPTDPNFSIGGTQDNGTNNLLASGTAWNRIDFGDGGFSDIDQNATDTTTVTMYHTYFNQTSSLIGFARVDTVAAAFDGNWTFFGCNGVPGNGIGCTDTVNFYAPTVLGPGNPNTHYFGSDRLYRSINKGVNNTVVSQAPITAGVPISSIAISLQDDNYRLVGLKNGGLFFTTTASSTLTSLDPVGGATVIPDKYVGRVLFDPNNKNTAYVGLGGYMGGTTPALSHVWKITNLNTGPVLAGINGSGITGLPDVPVNALAVDPQQSLRLFAGTDIGIYVSEDGGASWSPLGTGLPTVAVFGMAIQNGKRVLRIATHGRGMWEIALPTTLTLRKTWANAIGGDQVNVTSAGFTNNAASGFSASTGNNTDVVSSVLVFAGESGAISEAFSIGSASNYTASLACTGNATPLSGNTLTVTAGDSAIVCTQTNTRKQATLTLAKTWINAISGNTATVTSAGFTNAASSGLSTSTGNNTTTGSSVVVFAGESGTVSETFGAGSASNYTATLACTGNATPLSGNTLSVSGADTAIICTQTNTVRSLTLRKTWVNGKTSDTATVTSSGFTNAASSGLSTSTGNNTTTGSSVVVFAGESGTISEAFGVGSASNYTATLACTGNATPLSGNTLTVTAGDTAIVCTQTNTRKQATLTLAKTWVNGKISDTATVTSAGFTNAASSGLSISIGNNTTTGSSVVVFAGESGTISEAFGVSNTGNYVATLACTGNATPLSGNTLTVTPGDTTIVCTESNTFTTAQVSGTKVVSGSFFPGSTVTYSVVLNNTGNATAADNPGNEFSDVLPSSLTLVSATATGGTAVATVGTNTVTWNGSIAPAGSVAITITATINAAVLPGTVITNQGAIAFDADLNGTNESATTTDDPAVAGANNPTSFTVRGTLNIDASTTPKYDALTDGLIAIRYMLGRTGPELTDNALGSTATRTDPVAIKAYFDGMNLQLDIDGDGTVDAMSDGLLILRYLFGLRGDALISGAFTVGAPRNTAALIEAYLQTLVP